MRLAFTKKFLKQVSKLNNPLLAAEIETIIEEAEKAKTLSEIKNLKKLKGYNNYYRIRTGDYRIGIYFNKQSFEFAAIDHRKDIYKYFP
jgi:mRNA interferase RelE/StbE